MPETPFSRIVNRYTGLINRYGHDPRACDYGRAESQRIKFKVLADIMDLHGRSVLDVGCGFADFATYLRQRYSEVKYVGLDITPRMIEEAKRLQPDLDLRTGNILTEKLLETYDLVTANGIFYLLGENARETMRDIIRRMYETTEFAVAFNSLSAWAPEQEEGEFYADPVETLEFCRTITPWVTLRHDYHPRDFTIYMFKKQNA